MHTAIVCALASLTLAATTLAQVPYRPPVGAEFEHIPLPTLPAAESANVYNPSIDRFLVRWPKVALHANAVIEFDMLTRKARQLHPSAVSYDYPPVAGFPLQDYLAAPLGYVGEDIAFVTDLQRVVLINQNRSSLAFSPGENYSFSRSTDSHDAEHQAVVGIGYLQPATAPAGVIRKVVGQPATIALPLTGRPRNASFTYWSVTGVRAAGETLMFRASGGSGGSKLMYLKDGQIIDVGTLITAQTGFTLSSAYSYGGDADTWFATCALRAPGVDTFATDMLVRIKLGSETVQILPLDVANRELLGGSRITGMYPLELRASGSTAVLPVRVSTLVDGVPVITRRFVHYDGSQFRLITGASPNQLASVSATWMAWNRSIDGDRFILPTSPYSLSRYIPPDQRRRCLVDIANDRGEDLVEGRSTNSGLNESDYNFFMAKFFEADPACDFAYDNGTPFTYPTPPAPRGVVNNGVTEADYNLFFTQFFQPCP